MEKLERFAALFHCLVAVATATYTGSQAAYAGAARQAAAEIRCYDCTGFHCAGLIRKGYAGTCTAVSGKCFYRVDPNGLEYRGCADRRIWPGQLDMAYTGCQPQQYGMWHNVKVKWCFCAFDLCNMDDRHLLGGGSSGGGNTNYVANSGTSNLVKNHLANSIRNDYSQTERAYRTTFNRTTSSQRKHYMMYMPSGGIGPAPVVTLNRATQAPFPAVKQVYPNKPNQGANQGRIVQTGNGYGQGQWNRYPSNGNRDFHGNGNANRNFHGTGNTYYNGWAGRQNDVSQPTRPAPVFTRPAPATTVTPFWVSVPVPVTTPATPRAAAARPTAAARLPITTGYKLPFVNNNNNNVNINFRNHGVTMNPITNPVQRDSVGGNRATHSVAVVVTTPRTFNDLIGAGGRKGQTSGDNFGNDGRLDDFDPVQYGSCERAGCEHRCDVAGGVPVCRCNKGFQLAPDKKRCLDVDECREAGRNKGGCSHACFNSIGSFSCGCDVGYALDADQRTCIDFNECLDPKLSGMNCQHACENTAGSYRCTCRAGFQLNIDGKTCNDVDECHLGRHDCDQTCVGSQGSYTCSCFHGYYLAANGKTCLDENECLLDNGGCSQRCVNAAGGFQCECHYGFQLNVDRRSCDDVNECQSNNGGCQHNCKNTDGSFRCECRAGFMLEFDGKTCLDMNECRVDNGGCEQICENTEGSFRCACRTGYTLNFDKRSCDSQDACLVNNGGCAHVCTSLSAGPRCSCNQGYLLATDGSTCADINECQRLNGGCGQVCRNTRGSFTCDCRAGFSLNPDERTCDDMDECGTNNGGCQHICRNEAGSHVCDCYQGYRLATDKRTCIDINECDDNNGRCQGGCTNTDGSYTCSCTGDLQSLAADGRSCAVDCPRSFVKVNELESCYRVYGGDDLALNVPEAQQHCASLHPLAELVNIETDNERSYLVNIMETKGPMLEGWQGWWTAGYYHDGLNMFRWKNGEQIVDHWGFQRNPFEETCVWVLQIPIYNYTYGNYDCETQTGFICELELKRLN